MCALWMPKAHSVVTTPWASVGKNTVLLSEPIRLRSKADDLAVADAVDAQSGGRSDGNDIGEVTRSR